MGEETVSLSIIAKILEVEIVGRRRLRFVQCWSTSADTLDIALGRRCIPTDSETVHVQEAVAHLKQLVLGIIKLLLLSMWKKLRQVVLGALLRDSVGRVD